MSKNNYYVYAYLREDGTPYYIGKGKGRRAYNKHINIKVPPKERITYLEKNLNEEQSFEKEKEYILKYGRKDNQTGILRNLSNGGEGQSGYRHREEDRKKISSTLLDSYRNGHRVISNEHKDIISKTHRNKSISEYTRQVLREINTGKKHTEETIAKIRENSPYYQGESFTWMKGKKHNDSSKIIMGKKSSQWNKNQPIVKCTHCGLEKKNSGLMIRYHFDNCRFRPQEKFLNP